MNQSLTKTIYNDTHKNDVYLAMIKVGVKLLQREPLGHSFQTHDLVHEAYLRIQSIDNNKWKNRNHFVNVYTKIMKRILIDYARNSHSEKRGGLYQHQTLSDMPYELMEKTNDIELSEALDILNNKNPLLYRIVCLRFYSGLNINEIANTIGLSPATVKRKWSIARHHLLLELRNST